MCSLVHVIASWKGCKKIVKWEIHECKNMRSMQGLAKSWNPFHDEIYSKCFAQLYLSYYTIFLYLPSRHIHMWDHWRHSSDRHFRTFGNLHHLHQTWPCKFTLYTFVIHGAHLQGVPNRELVRRTLAMISDHTCGLSCAQFTLATFMPPSRSRTTRSVSSAALRNQSLVS